MILLRLYWEFLKIGLFSLGGGVTTLPFLYRLADSSGWFTPEQVTDMIAVSESTPGPVGINMATYAGYEMAGVPGAVAATLGEITPGIILVLLIARVLARFRSNFYVESAFYGIRPCSTALIASAGVLLLRVSLLRLKTFGASGRLADLFHLPSIILAASVWVCTNLIKPTRKLHPIVFIGISAVVGVLFSFAER